VVGQTLVGEAAAVLVVTEIHMLQNHQEAAVLLKLHLLLLIMLFTLLLLVLVAPVVL